MVYEYIFENAKIHGFSWDRMAQSAVSVYRLHDTRRCYIPVKQQSFSLHQRPGRLSGPPSLLSWVQVKHLGRLDDRSPACKYWRGGDLRNSWRGAELSAYTSLQWLSWDTVQSAVFKNVQKYRLYTLSTGQVSSEMVNAEFVRSLIHWYIVAAGNADKGNAILPAPSHTHILTPHITTAVLESHIKSTFNYSLAKKAEQTAFR